MVLRILITCQSDSNQDCDLKLPYLVSSLVYTPTIHRNIHIKRKISMKQLFANLGGSVRPLHWHYDTRVLRWIGHIARMKLNRLPRMLLTSWVPHPRPIGCPRMTYGRTIKKAMKRREEIWPGLPFDKPDNWTALTVAARQRLRQKHAKEARKHETVSYTHLTLPTKA